MEPYETRVTEEKVHIIDDSMPATRHPSTGEVFESKSAFRAVTKAHGLEEVGNEYVGKPTEYFQPKPKKLADTRALLERAWEQRR